MDIKKITVLTLFLSIVLFHANAQVDSFPVFKHAEKKYRDAEYDNLTGYISEKNLAALASDSLEDHWINSFYTIEFLQYKLPYIETFIRSAFDSLNKRSTDFQRELLELVYSVYPKEFIHEVSQTALQTKDDKAFVMCLEYLMQAGSKSLTKKIIAQQYSDPNSILNMDSDHPVIERVLMRINNPASLKGKIPDSVLASLLDKNYLSGNVVAYSFQRKSRDYPGIVIIKDTAGNFIKNDDSSVSYIQQLARSIGNLPSYLTNGNTPQGIFKMYGFDISKSAFIGPTKNIQLALPFEMKVQKFLKDSTLRDSAWSLDLYKRLLPPQAKNDNSLYQTYYAGETGRSEIIAHGTTINPEYYSDKIYYPQTPTSGCLCTYELWSEYNGKRLFSDQQKLVDVVAKAGGANGYYRVVEIICHY
jgi:hypothetical protein